MTQAAFAVYLSTVVFVGAAFAARVQDVNVPSLSMNKQIPAIVILPDSYFKTDKTYPVVYLLHGYSSSPKKTFDVAGEIFTAAADKYEMIIFLPDGGYNSWYFDSPILPQQKYETHIASEIVQFADSHFRTIPSAWARAITGGSMGGHGAMFVALRHKDIFGSVGSLSGAVDFRPFPENWDIKQTLGPIAQFSQRWDEYVVINNLPRLKPDELTIYLDIGTKDAFIEVNRALHKKLLVMDIPHVYIERPGHHDDHYWRVAIKYQLFFFSEIFREKSIGRL
ncbi:MAG: alpha/beta hydrolase-fold protein [Sedimentisphaerales bacterium]|nr:alpha/beta hydrolase-fold protein [Sedimentisphaerales bacterium]